MIMYDIKNTQQRGIKKAGAPIRFSARMICLCAVVCVENGDEDSMRGEKASACASPLLFVAWVEWKWPWTKQKEKETSCKTEKENMRPIDQESKMTIMEKTKQPRQIGVETQTQTQKMEEGKHRKWREESDDED